jgi:GT2 family glycosyltransferase
MSRDKEIAAVVIGRNEGSRLKACLAALQQQAVRVVYADSGSTDGSAALARSMGAQTVELDPSEPFTAARGRNAGFAALEASGDMPQFVQFLDGDCLVEDGWLDAAANHLRQNPDLGLVTGWRAEMFPERSLYNALCDAEWHRPAGVITVCGGDMMVRSSAFRAAGGFDPAVIAAEDDEFCLRLGKAGWGLERLPLAMTRHDADMTRFAQWWTRAVRCGHGFEQVGLLHPPHFRRERLRVLAYGLGLPVLFGLSLLAGWWAAALPAGLYLLSYLRTAQELLRGGMERALALRQAGLLTLSKFPNLLGLLSFRWKRWRGQAARIIEYK